MSKPKFYPSGYMPLNYQEIDNINGRYSPSMVKSYNNQTFEYWERSLFQRACSIMEFKLPEEWEGSVRDFFYYCLFRFGYIGIFNLPEFGLTFQPGSLNGRDWYYQFTEFIVSNPNLPEGVDQTFRIHKNCELLKLTPDYMGIWPIISYHAEKLAALDTSINTNIINSKFAYLFGASTKAANEGLRKAMDLINKGEPAVIIDNLMKNDMQTKDSPFQFVERSSIKNSYIISDLLADFQTILSRFDSEVGIPTLPQTNKKERMISDEANMKTIDGAARALVWKNSIDSSLKLVNEMFGTSISCIFKYDPEKLKEGGTDNEQLQDNSDRA